MEEEEQTVALADIPGGKGKWNSDSEVRKIRLLSWKHWCFLWRCRSVYFHESIGASCGDVVPSTSMKALVFPVTMSYRPLPWKHWCFLWRCRSVYFPESIGASCDDVGPSTAMKALVLPETMSLQGTYGIISHTSTCRHANSRHYCSTETAARLIHLWLTKRLTDLDDLCIHVHHLSQYYPVLWYYNSITYPLRNTYHDNIYKTEV